MLKLTGGKKRNAYTAFSDEDRAKINIGKHAAENGNSSALKKFRRVYPDLGESTVRSFKRKYYEVLKEQVRQSGQSAIVESIPSKKRGRPLTLGDLDNEVQQYVRALRTAGTPVGSPVMIAAARGIVMAKKSSLASRKCGHVVLSKSWAHCLMIRMGLVKRKASTKAPKKTTEEFEQKKVSFLKQVSAFVAVHTILSSLVQNWDRTGINVPSADYTMEQRVLSESNRNSWLPRQLRIGYDVD